MDKNRPIYITHLREVLDHSGLTTKEAANEFGVAHRTMQSYIAGERRVHKYLRGRMATFFNCDENFLFPPYASFFSQNSAQSPKDQGVAEPLQDIGNATNLKLVGKWERGKHKPSPSYQERLDKLFSSSASQPGLEEQYYLNLARQILETAASE